ncbi:MAG: TlpA family protein disulfide reductase [Bacteroidales bacterium]|nr:TlpA family protein disulfide reductase [Bacteroidales bacterium]
MKYLILYLLLLGLPFSAFPVDSLRLAQLHYALPQKGLAYVGHFQDFITQGDSITGVIFRVDSLIMEIRTIQDSLRYTPLRHGEKVLALPSTSFPLDSVKAYTKNTAPIITLKGNDIGSLYDFFWVPFTYAQYDDMRLNAYPITGQHLNYYETVIDSVLIQITIDPRDDGPQFFTPSLPHGIREGVEYKYQYALGDAIPLRSCLITPISIDEDKLNLSYLSQPLTHSTIKAPAELWDSVTFPEGKDYLLLEFFGTWCNPCREGILALKDYVDHHYVNFGIVTVSCEFSRDFTEAKDFFASHSISWPVIYETIDTSLSSLFKIQTYPRYILISPNGDILIDTNNLDEIFNQTQSPY